jgi:hypothetical protein
VYVIGKHRVIRPIKHPSFKKAYAKKNNKYGNMTQKIKYSARAD